MSFPSEVTVLIFSFAADSAKQVATFELVSKKLQPLCFSPRDINHNLWHLFLKKHNSITPDITGYDQEKLKIWPSPSDSKTIKEIAQDFVLGNYLPYITKPMIESVYFNDDPLYLQNHDCIENTISVRFKPIFLYLKTLCNNKLCVCSLDLSAAKPFYGDFYSENMSSYHSSTLHNLYYSCSCASFAYVSTCARWNGYMVVASSSNDEEIQAIEYFIQFCQHVHQVRIPPIVLVSAKQDLMQIQKLAQMYHIPCMEWNAASANANTVQEQIFDACLDAAQKFHTLQTADFVFECPHRMLHEMQVIQGRDANAKKFKAPNVQFKSQSYCLLS